MKVQNQITNSSKTLTESSLCLQMHINSTLFGTLGILVHSFKLKVMSNTTGVDEEVFS